MAYFLFSFVEFSKNYDPIRFLLFINIKNINHIITLTTEKLIIIYGKNSTFFC